MVIYLQVQLSIFGDIFDESVDLKEIFIKIQNMWRVLRVRQDVLAIFEAPTITSHLGHFQHQGSQFGSPHSCTIFIMSLILIPGQDCQCCILIQCL